MFQDILILDFETRWSRSPRDWCPDSYTLSKMTTEEYIRSPLFKAFGAGYKWYGRDGPADMPLYLPNPFLKGLFANIDWSKTAVCCHNAQFDVAILTWIFGVKPAFIFDTLSMARALYGIEVGNSAAKLAERYGLPPKGTATQSSDGMFELTHEVEKELGDYCKHDVTLCEAFLDRMLPQFPKKELRLIDATIRMFTEPQLALDKDLLQGAIDEDVNLRNTLLGKLGVTDADLASNDKFAATLAAIGVEPPKKQSPTTGKEVFAFAKNDALFQQILNGDNEEAVLLCEARMKVKSTQERTRAQRFLDIAGRGDGKLPVPVNYAHTRTNRWGASKGSSINMQNLKRGGKLRKAIIAPDGHQCVAGDLSQIEPRVLAYLADFQELLDIFASGKDAYAQFGAGMFGIPGLSKESHPDLRQSAKSALLGCFAASTRVETSNGVKDIVDVTLEDLLWDGVEWVTHTGVVAQGSKPVISCAGVSATADHKVLIREEWMPWEKVVARYTALGDAPMQARHTCETYDISNAGPRNRFTIKSAWGDLVVHNCGYRLGWAAFSSQLLVGFLGAPPVRYDKAFMKQLGIGGPQVIKFMEGDQGRARLERMMEIPHTCTDQELLVHCVCAKEIIDRYRRASAPITRFWDFLDKMIATVIAVPDAAPVTHKCLTFMPGKIQLPNGLFMTYDGIKVSLDEFRRPQYTYWNGKTHKALHSGIVAENVTSGTARCVIGDGMLRIQPRYRCAMPVHDEGVWVVPDAEVPEAKVWIKEQMCAPVKYLPGIPLDASVGAHRRYGESK